MAEARGRAEVDDLRGDRPADAVEPADPLLDDRRVPRQVEQDQPAAELEVPPLAAGLGRDQDRRPLGEPELRHLDVPPLGRELLVEDAGPPPLPLDRPLQQVERLAMGHEDQRLLVRPRPAAGLLDQPAHPRVARARPRRRARRSPSSSRSTTESRAAGEARARKTRSALRRLASGFSAGWARRWRTSRSEGLPTGVVDIHRHRHARRQAADVHPAGGAGARAAAARGGRGARRTIPPPGTPRGAGAGADGRSRGRRPPAAWR